MKQKITSALICLLLIANVSVVLGIPEDKINISEKIKYFSFVKLFNQEHEKYVILDTNTENEMPCGNVSGKGPNLAPNPSFEEGDSMPTGWTYDPNTNGTYTWDSHYAYSGEKSIGVLNLTNNSDSSYLMWTTTDFIPVDCTVNSYMLSVWFKFVEIPPDCHFAMIRILEYDINHHLIGSSGVGIGSINSTEWCHFGSSTYYNTSKYVKLEIGQWYDLMGEPNPLIEIRYDDVNFSIWNTAPSTPTITGETHGRIRTLYNYTITTTDPDQDNVSYEIYWGDNITQTTDFYESGEEIIFNHIWGNKGVYQIRVRAIDEYYAKSDWATLDVTMPYTYTLPFMQFWMKILERLPNTFLILRHFLGY